MRPRHVVSLALTALVLAVLVPVGRAEPSSAWRLEGRVPASSIAFLSVEDVGTWDRRLEATGIGRLANDPDMQAFLKPVLDWLREPTAGKAGPLEEIPPILLDFLKQVQGLHGQAAVAFLGMDAEKGTPQVVMSMDFGPHASDFVAFLGRLQKEMDPSGEHIQTAERDGRTWWTMDADGLPVAATTSDTTFVIATGETLLVSALQGGASGTLAGSGDFLAVQKRFGGDAPMLRLYANVAAALSTFGEGIPPEARKAMDSFGLDTIRAAGYGISFAGDGFTDTLAIHAPGAQHGIVAMYRMPPLDAPSFLPLAPAGTAYFGEANMDFGAYWAEMRKMIGAMGDERMTAELEEGIAKVNASLGMDLEKELLAGLARGYGFYLAMPEAGGLYPELVVGLKVKDPTAFEATMEKLAGGIAGMVNEEGDVVAQPRTIEFRGQRLHLFQMQAARGDDPIPFTPTWTLLGDRLLVSLVPHALKEVLLRAQATGAAGLAAQPDFQAVAKQIPAGAGVVAYLDLQALLSLVYDTGVPLLQTIAKPNVLEGVPFPLDWSLLPPGSVVRPHLTSLGMGARGDADGVVITMHGPIPTAPLMVAGMALPWLMVSRGMSSGFRPGPSMDVDIDMPSELGAEMDRDLAEVQIEDLVGKVELFLLDRKEMPVDLGQLVEAEILDRVPSDPWGQPFRLRVTDADAKTFAVESAGPDRMFGTEDDIQRSSR